MKPPAGRIIGRKVCIFGCGFHAAHVRQNEGRHAYVYCPGCGLTAAARNGIQSGILTKGMRAELLDAAAAPVVVAEVQPAAATPAAPPAPVRKPQPLGLFEQLAGRVVAARA